MSTQHKEALAVGRAEGRAVRAYLEALEAHKPKRGRKRTPESMRKKLAEISSRIDGADPLKRLLLIQERMDLEEALNSLDNKPDIDSLEQDFISAAKGYSERKGITYAAWRELGVPAAVLSNAGITRTAG